MIALLFTLIATLFSFTVQADSPVLLRDSGNHPTIILLMVDGIRPDVVDHMAESQELPNIKRYFMDNGTSLENSFTSLSLTVPSWSTILTGIDIDRTGIKGNDFFDRYTKSIENFLDVRKEIIFEKYRRHGRAYRAMREAGIPLLMDRMNRGSQKDEEGYTVDSFGKESEVFMTLNPLNDQFPLSLFHTLLDNLLNLDLWREFSAHDAAMRLLFDYSAASSLDRDNLDQALKVLQETNGKKKKLIGIYLQNVDTLSHHDHIRGRRTLRELDHQIGRIFLTLHQSRYSDSIVALVSDHGSIGGEEYQIDNLYNPLRGESFALTLTNLSHYLSGWYNKPGYADYNMNVESALAAEGKFSLKNLTEFQLQPFQCSNLARPLRIEQGTCAQLHSSNPNQIHAAVASSETIYLPYASFDSNNWNTPNTWHTLTHYTVGRDEAGKPKVRNLIQDLENFTLDNLLVFDSTLASQIGNHPLDWLAIVLDKKPFHPVLGQKLGVTSDEDVVLIHKNSSNQALILRGRSKNGQTLFRYVPIKNFQEDSQGKLSFEFNFESDPLAYTNNPWANRESTGISISDTDWFVGYHTDREWTGRYAGTAFPNTVPALTRFMSFRGKMEHKKGQLRADLYLNPRYGHWFSINNEPYEVAHGMWQRESVRNLFMVTGPGIRRGAQIQTPVFTTDVVPTVLRASGYHADGKFEGEAFWNQFDGRPIDEIFE